MDVKLPKLGENAEGGTVVSILVKEGDSVTEGQTILELENEKAVAPIPATATGVVSKILAKEGDRLTIGQLILTIDAAGAAPAKADRPAATPKPAAPKVATPTPPSTPTPGTAPAPVDESADADAGTPVAAPEGPIPPASPEIRRIARELGIDLRLVRPSGLGGRVEWGDLKTLVQRLQRLANQPRQAAGPAATAAATPPAEPIDFSKWGGTSRQRLSILRKTISRRMSESWHAVPRVTQFDEADITDLMELRKKFAGDYEKKGARLTLTSFALRAASVALQKHPIFNSSLDPATDEVVLKEYIHLGLAVDTEHGLMVPVIRDVDRKPLFQLSQDVHLLAEKARERKLSLDDMKGGTFTISNQGGIGGGHFTPIVNTPEVAILGLGKGTLKPVIHDGKVAPRLMLPIAVSYDHRVIDGGTAARFTVDLVAAFLNFSEADVKL